MSLQTQVSRTFTHVLLSQVLNRLSSISATVTPEQLDELVQRHLDHEGELAYKENNDLGLCIRRAAEHCQLFDVSEPAAVEAFLADFITEDEITSSTLAVAVEDIAAAISTPLYWMRSTLPQKALELVTQINAKVPNSQEAIQPTTLRKFDWGKLQDPRHRMLAMSYAQDRLSGTFRNNVAHYLDTPNLLALLAQTTAKSLPSVETVRPILANAMEVGVLADVADAATREKLLSYKELALDLLCNPRQYAKTFQEVQQTLTTSTATTVVALTDMIDAVEDLVHLLDTKVITALNSDTQISTENLLANMESVSNSIQTVRASMIYLKDHALKDALLLTRDTVNVVPFEAFLADGGTEAMICDYVTYRTLQDDLKISNSGVSAKTVHAQHEKAAVAVKAATESLAVRTKAHRAQAIQSSLQLTLMQDYQRGLKTGEYQPQMVQQHKVYVNRALVSLQTRPLDEIATNYVVDMTEQPLHKELYDTATQKYNAMIKTKDDITQQDIAQATCETVLSVLSTRLKPFILPQAA